MRFRKGICYPHLPRGPGRGRYHMSEAALRARRRNLRAAADGGKVKRLRSGRESLIIKLLIWQSCFDSGPRPSQRQLACTLGVWPSYVWKVMRKAATVGLYELSRYHLQHGGVTLDDLAEARRFTAKLREQEPGLLAPPPQARTSDEPRIMTEDERIAETWREVAEWKRKNLWRYDTRRRIRVPIPR